MNFIKSSVKILSFCLLISTFSLSVSADNDASQVGRYQIVFGPHARADMFLLDTVTGRTWEYITYTNLEGKPDMWVEEDRIDIDSIHRSISGVIKKYGKTDDKTDDNGPEEWLRVEKNSKKKDDN